jgi:hypothetical protein
VAAKLKVALEFIPFELGVHAVAVRQPRPQRERERELGPMATCCNLHVYTL